MGLDLAEHAETAYHDATSTMTHIDRSHGMKLVTAVIKPFKLDDVKEALQGIGSRRADGVGGAGPRTPTGSHRGVPRAEYQISFLPKVRIEILVDDADVERVTNTLVEAARTGKIGDGKVWVTAAESVIRIRTGEVGADAL